MNLRRWWPPLTWMGAILTATSIPRAYLPVVEFRLADKIVHVFMYGVLGLLMTRALDETHKPSRVRALFGAFLFCVVVGAVDEWHQGFVAGRVADVFDWSADAIGGLAGGAAWLIRGRQHDPHTI